MFKYIALSCFLILFSQPAFAYIDLGSSSMIIQLAIASIASALFAIKAYFHSIKIFIKHKILRISADENPQQTQTEEENQ